MTLLERFDEMPLMLAVTTEKCQVPLTRTEIRRAIAIAQAVEDYGATFGRPMDMKWIMRRADEMLEGR